MINNIKENIYKKTGYEVINVMVEDNRLSFSCFNERDEFALFYLYQDGVIRDEKGREVIKVSSKYCNAY